MFSYLLDPLLIIPILGTVGISLFIIASTAYYLFWYQILFFIIGIIFFIFISSLDYRIWIKFIWIIYFLGIFFLIASFFGPKIRGTTRWIEMFGFTFQPSEILKPFMIVFLSYLHEREFHWYFSSFAKRVIFFLPFLIIIFKQPDLGNVLVYLSFFICIEISGGMPWSYLFLAIPTTFAFFPIFWHALRDYQKQRIFSFLNPSFDRAGVGYNALQAIIAIGSGQIFGLGFGRETQSRLLFLPEYHTDFIFASLIETLGFFGGVLVFLFYFLILSKIISVAYHIRDPFAKLLLVGIFAQLFIQIFINIGMNLGILPITGITLPLISYGGNSIISTFISLGFVVSVSRYRKKSLLVIR